ncbi:MAG: dihydroorotase [Eubacteriales bacterium]|nr:dihydroorotase [Eubacteriales bacterium]
MMRALYRNAAVFRRGVLERLDVAVSGGRIDRLARGISPMGFDRVFNLKDLLLVPGFVDVHVHLREPGFSYKETIETGTLAAARGGYSCVCAMPNVDPPPDDLMHLKVQLDAIERGAQVRVLPYGALTRGRKGEGAPADYAALAPCVAGFSDDGVGVRDEAAMSACMRAVRSVGGIVAAHCEDESMLNGGYIHDGAYARRHGHKGIPSESEWRQLARDLELVRRIGCRYHLCHASTKESVTLIREAKREGLDVSCETAPHYLVLTDEDMEEHGRFKMNPPLRSAADRDALIEGLNDGTVDMIATDHAPHSAEEKGRGLAGSAMGVVGLETAFPVLYTRLVEPGTVPLEVVLTALTDAPRRRFALPGGLPEGAEADFAVWDLHRAYAVDPKDFASMGRATPFEGWTVKGLCRMTMVGGRRVYGDLSDRAQ